MKATVIRVNYCRANTVIPMGRLAYKDRRILFEYALDFLELGLQLSPFKLPLRQGIISCDDRVFDGLFGVFNDSLPDGWGKLLLDRKLQKLGIDPDSQTPLDRLQAVGSHGMGALQYEPELLSTKDIQPFQDLDRIAEACMGVLKHDEDACVDDLFTLNGSSCGARPKIILRLLPKKGGFAQSKNTPDQANNDWLIKFRSSVDPKDVGVIEYAYHLMAKNAGLDVPQAKLFASKKCGGYFGVKRFDRTEHTFLHTHTVCGLLHADFRLPCLDYETILKATLWLTKDIRQCEKQFYHTVFNVLAHNRDDHSKNFSFVMDAEGSWQVSPAYDLIYSYGPQGEHSTTVMCEGKNPGKQHLLQLATRIAITQEKASSIIEHVSTAVSKWSVFAKEAHVSPQSRNKIQSALNNICKNFS